MPRKKANIKIVEEEQPVQIPEVNAIQPKNKIIAPDIKTEDNLILEIAKFAKDIQSNINYLDGDELDNLLNEVTEVQNKIIVNTQHLINCSDNCITIKKTIEEQKEQKEKIRKESLKKNKKFLTLEDLISVLPNYEQIKRLQKILPDNQDYAKVYLQGYTVNTEKSKKNLLGTIKILGQYNFQKKERESYQIKVLQNEPQTLWCSCIDHKLNSAKKGTVCKHIAFIVCKVMKILELEFFETKKLSDEQINTLLDRFSDKSDLWKNKSLVRNLKQINLDTFKMFPEPFDDVCTFCYDALTDIDKPKSVCCPACRHSYHSECMDIWLENYLRCSVCSSDIWKHYNTIKIEGVVNINSNEL